MDRESSWDQYEAESCVRNRCRSCFKASRELVDGWCPKCRGEEVDRSRTVKRAMADLHRRCANKYPSDAAWFTAQAERLEAES